MARHIKKESVMRNASYLGLSNIFSYGLLFFSTVYIARILMPADFGKINFAQTLAIYVSFLTDGMKIYGVREIAKNKEISQLVIDKNLLNIHSASIIQFIAFFAFILLLPIDMDYKVLLITFALSSFIMASFFTDWIYQGYEVMRVVAIGNLIRYFSYVVLILLFFAYDANIKWVGIATLLGAIIASFPLVSRLPKINVKFRLHCNVRGLFNKNTLKVPIILGLSCIRNQLFYTPVTIILGLQAFHADVGIFNAAFKLAFFIGSLGNVYVLSIFPRVSSLCVGSVATLSLFINNSMRFLNYILVPIGFGGVYLSGEIVSLVFGEAYILSSHLFGIILWAIIIMLWSYNYSSVLIGFNRQDIFSKILVIALICNLAANFFLINLFGSTGGAVTALLSEIIVLFCFMMYCKRLFGLRVNFHLLSPVAGSVFMISVLWILGADYLVANVIIGIIAYLGFMQFFTKMKVKDVLNIEVETDA